MHVCRLKIKFHIKFHIINALLHVPDWFAIVFLGLNHVAVSHCGHVGQLTSLGRNEIHLWRDGNPFLAQQPQWHSPIQGRSAKFGKNMEKYHQFRDSKNNRSNPYNYVKITFKTVRNRSDRSDYVQITFKLRSITFNYVRIYVIFT